MKRTVDTYSGGYPTNTNVDDAIGWANHRGVVTGVWRLQLKGEWLVRVDYELFEDEADFAYASARDRDLGEGFS